MSKRVLNSLLIALASVTVAAFSTRGQATAQTGTIGGTVMDAQGKPVENAAVTYLRAPDLTGQPGPVVSGGVTTGPKGTFIFDKLPPGKYLFCAYVDPALAIAEICEWTLLPPSVQLAAGQKVAEFTLTLTPGLNLQVRVSDPKGLLANPATKTKGAILRAGVWDDQGLFHTIKFRSFDSAGQNFSLALPFGKSYRFDASAIGASVQGPSGDKLYHRGQGRRRHPAICVVSLRVTVA